MNANLQIIITTPPVALVKTWCQLLKDADPEIDVATISHNIHMASAFPGYLYGVIAMFCISSGSMQWSKSKAFKFGGYVLAI